MIQAFSNYHILNQIGESPNSVVYRAIRESDNLPVILKVMRSECPSPAELTRYQQEYELTRTLNVEGVVKTYGLEKHQNTLAIVLEDFGGHSFNFWLKHRSFTLTDCLSLATQIANSLGQLHTAHVIHKDINPANLVWNAETNRLKLIDFGIATRLPCETLSLQNPNQLEGTLPYLSPEQTGRMNRALDYRTDLYSLGVTFYELFTGRLPFEGNDAMELVHCHLAKQPIPPHHIKTDIPLIISHLILRLMAKSAEERYQSAWGVKTDLEQILISLTHFEDLSGFKLGQHDFSDHFQLPQTLYGREDVVAPLFSTFENVAQGLSELLLVAGYSGIGKTSVVQEIYKPITEKRGYFIAGKFDQFQRNIPYSAVVQAFRDLVRQLLTETQSQLDDWKTQLLAAIGVNGQILVEVIPEIELLLGKQPAIPTLPPTESQNRFNLVFQNFIKVFCQPAHPLVIFLDDLQWIDSASLKLMTLMMSDIPYLLLIGAYRDNEVNPTHPLIITVEDMQKQGIPVQTLILMPLMLPHLNQLVSDALHLPLVQTLLLAELVLEKTGGNPFFAGEFLKTLYTEQLLTFNAVTHQWQWDLVQIKTRNITDNVVELMASKIKQLSEKTQQYLTLAAALGNQFNLITLSTVSQQSSESVKRELWEALITGLITLIEENYKFVHDRIQQAAYSLIPETERASIHLEIGRLWLAKTVDIEQAEPLLEIVNQLNAGRQWIKAKAEQLRLAELNLVAGRRAKSSAAYEIALSYFTTGISLLTETPWQHMYALVFDLSLEQAECHYLLGHFEAAESGFDLILSQAKTALEKAIILCKKVVLYNHRQFFRESLLCGKEGLALLDNPAPREAEVKAAIGEAMETIKTCLAEGDIEALIDLPELTDPSQLKVMELCMTLLPTSYTSGEFDLFTWLILKTVTVSLRFGNSRLSSHAYTAYGVILSVGFSEYEIAYRFAKLGEALGQKYPDMTVLGKNEHIFGVFIAHWKYPVKVSLDYLLAAYPKLLETGDLEFATYAIHDYLTIRIYTGKNLEFMQQELKKYFPLIEKINNGFTIDSTLLYLQLVSRLLGQTSDNDDLEEKVKTVAKQSNNFQTVARCLLNKLLLHILYGDYANALDIAREAESVMGTLIGTLHQTEFCFYYALTLATQYPILEESDKEKLTEYQTQLKNWAEQCPENFQHMDSLVRAKMAEQLGEDRLALKYYKQAIESARENEFTHKEALAHELVAGFWLSQEEEDYAKIHLCKAHYAYSLWGAVVKVNELEQKYPQWLLPQKMTSGTVSHTIPANTLSTTRLNTTRFATGTEWLDLTSVMKAAQTLSGEIVLENLLTKMMHTVIENAGAQRGVLILEQQGHWLIQAEMRVQPDTVTVLQALPLEDSLPITLLNYVIRTKQSIVLADFQKESQYQGDEYAHTHRLKSVLALTLLHQQKLVGVIYLENNLTTGAFTPDRFQVLTLLSSQMAISLENARFVNELEQARQVAEAANRAKTAFLANVSHELKTPLNGILGCSQMLKKDTQLTSQQQASIEIIYHSGEHLLTLVNDILDIAKLQTAQIELQLTDVSLSKLFNDLCHWYREQTKEKRLTLHTQFSPTLPTGIVADGKRLRQILLQLLSNAVKFTQQGSITFRVESQPSEKQPGWHHFQWIITDTGIGISPEQVTKLFTPFEQASDWLHKSAGVGLGLSLVKQLVELMGGQLQATSQTGQGSTFTVYLDFAESHTFLSEILPEQTPSVEETTIPLKGPSAKKAAELCDLAQMGDFLGILKLIQQLEKTDETLKPFTEKVRQLAKNYQDEAIEELARQFMT